MKIGIDVRCLAEGRRTGVEEYTLNLLEHIFELDKENDYVLFFNSWRPAKTDFSWTEKYANVKIKKFNFPNKLLNLSFWYLGWPKIDRLLGGADIFFAPNIFFGSVSKKTKLALVVHDLSFERYPEYFSPKRRLWHFLINPKKVCLGARAIIAVSRSTKNDLISLYGVSPDKIKVVPSGVSRKYQVMNRNDRRFLEVKKKYGLPWKFIFYLGTIEPRKNIGAIVRAYDRLQKDAEERGDERMQKYKLVIAGENGWMREKIIWEMKKADSRKNIYLLNFVEEEDKKYAYNLASLFVYPSFFEGFGFPPLEAMGCGVPVICSNNSSFPETSGESAIMIDPDKPEEIFLAMRSILSDSEISRNMVSRGIQTSQKFSWEKTAREVLDLFQSMV